MRYLTSEILRTSQALFPALVHLAQCQSRGSDLALFDLAVAQRQNLEQCQSLLGPFVALDILHHDPRLAVLGDDHRLLLLAQLANDVGRVGLEVADGFDLRRRLHRGSLPAK